ncbi:MAG: hypothetical protein AAGM22_20540 [Acidobacteriota bacterium]
MSDQTKPLIPVTNGRVAKTTVDEIAGLGSPVSIDHDADGLRYVFDGERLDDAREVRLDAVVSRAPKELAGDDSKLVTFRHPDDPKLVIGVVLNYGKTQPEIDGVWVADDGGGLAGGGDA